MIIFERDSLQVQFEYLESVLKYLSVLEIMLDNRLKASTKTLL
jgi:hypothetical protein